MPSTALRRAGTVAAVLATGAAAWEVQRRVDARRIAADPEHAELSRRIDGTPVEVRSEDGTRLHAEVFGPDDAPVVVLVHGWTCTLDFWHYQIRDLMADHRVVAYDQRGHGRSARPGVAAYSKDALAADLQAVLDTCVGKERRCVVAGHSMGGMTVVAWAARHAAEVADRLSGAMLVDTGMGDLVAQSNLIPWLRTGRLRTALGLWFLTAPVRPQRASTPLSLRGVRFAAMGPGASPARVAFCERMTMGCPTEVRAGFGREISAFDLYEGVPALTVPTVVLVGEVDRLTPPWHSRRLADTLPHLVELAELPGIGHNSPVEAPDEITRRLRDLARTGAGARAVPTG